MRVLTTTVRSGQILVSFSIYNTRTGRQLSAHEDELNATVLSTLLLYRVCYRHGRMVGTFI